MDDFNRFTDEAFKVIMLAQEESRRLGHNWVGTEQILLGLIGEGRDAATVLKSKGVNLENSRIEVEKIIGRGSGFVAGEIPFTSRAKKVLELSLQEADQVGQKFISTPILLLALIRISNGISRKVLDNLGIDIENIRYEVLERFFKDDVEILNFVDSKIELKDKCEKKQSDKEFDNNEENDLVSQLERLASLKERGLLTNKEFVEAKRRLLF